MSVFSVVETCGFPVSDPRFNWQALALWQGCSASQEQHQVPPVMLSWSLQQGAKFKVASRKDKDLATSIELVNSSPEGEKWGENTSPATSGPWSQHWWDLGVEVQAQCPLVHPIQRQLKGCWVPLRARSRSWGTWDAGHPPSLSWEKDRIC